MKALGFFLFILVNVFCRLALADTDRPADLIKQTIRAIQTEDRSSLAKLLGGQALCVWLKDTEITKLKDVLKKSGQIRPEITLTKKQHTSAPKPVGFWSYLEEQYAVKWLDSRRSMVAESLVECHFGIKGFKDNAYINRSRGDYPMRNCRIVVLEARSFTNPTIDKDCSVFTDRL